MSNREKIIYESLLTLVEVGKHDGNFEPGKLPSAHAYGLFWHKWEETLATWTLDEIFFLIKGFVYFERMSDSNGFGSVPPVPQIFSLYSSKVDQISADTLANWILANTVNEYCPFGTNNHGAKSLIHLEQINHLKATNKQAIQIREIEREKSAKLSRAHEATIRLPRAIERNDVKAVTALMLKGADPDYLLADGQTARQIAKRLGREEILQNVAQ